jgi:threonine synthase
VTIATLAKLAAAGVVRPDERVVALVTGHGLKTAEVLAGTVGPSATIAPTIEAFEGVLGVELEGR